MNDTVNVIFIPESNEKKRIQVPETRWLDPNDQEYRTIRTTFDVKRGKGRYGQAQRRHSSRARHANQRTCGTIRKVCGK